MMNRQNIIIGCLGVLLLLSVVAGLYTRRSDSRRISELEAELDVMHEKEQQSEVDRRVSKQMEEIAFGQQALSEERSREAIRQSEIAQEMTLRSETERQKAIQAQGIAEMSASEAMNAYQMAEQQRVEAEEQRRQAEHAKLVADTLNYISLGRTLGSQSYSIYRTGDTEIGNMLAYASYLYTSEYGGDLYASAVFQALTQSAGGRRSWSIHNGSISRIDISSKDGRVYTTSTYGEIFAHRMADGQMQTTRLLNDRSYCFRDVYAAKSGKAYAVSTTGHLVTIDGDRTRIIGLENIDKPFRLLNIGNDRQLLIVGENSIALFDTATEKTIGTRRLDYRIVCTSRRDNYPLLFDDRGGMHLVKSIESQQSPDIDITNEKVPVKGQVTAFASSKNAQTSAYGMSDGTIWLIAPSGTMYKLMEHLSQVTKLKFNGPRLYSSSYDGKLLFWVVDNNKPITLIKANSWLTDFTFSTDKDYIWTTEYNGTVTECLVSLPKIAQRISQKVKRNFSQQEWDYYVGKGIPYRKVKVKSEK